MMDSASEPVDPKACPADRHIENEWSFDFRRLSEYGVLWLVNRVVFHPRGFALALNYEDGNDEPVGWQIMGDGSEPWAFAGIDEIENERFATFEALLQQAREFGQAPHA